jgi:Fe-S cluster biogenesis protein NfuA
MNFVLMYGACKTCYNISMSELVNHIERLQERIQKTMVRL